MLKHGQPAPGLAQGEGGVIEIIEIDLFIARLCRGESSAHVGPGPHAIFALPRGKPWGPLELAVKRKRSGHRAEIFHVIGHTNRVVASSQGVALLHPQAPFQILINQRNLKLGGARRQAENLLRGAKTRPAPGAVQPIRTD